MAGSSHRSSCVTHCLQTLIKGTAIHNQSIVPIEPCDSEQLFNASTLQHFNTSTLQHFNTSASRSSLQLYYQLFQRSNMTIIGTTSRFVSGRSAVQTVYWRAANGAKNGEAQSKLVKTNRTLNFSVPSNVAANELPASRTNPQPIKSFH